MAPKCVDFKVQVLDATNKHASKDGSRKELSRLLESRQDNPQHALPEHNHDLSTGQSGDGGEMLPSVSIAHVGIQCESGQHHLRLSRHDPRSRLWLLNSVPTSLDNVPFVVTVRRSQEHEVSHVPHNPCKDEAEPNRNRSPRFLVTR